MTFKAPDSLAEQIARHLADRIIRGDLKPRERIQEQKVTQALGVSRGSVREALLILERRHLIAILPRRGAQVTELTAHNVRCLYALVIDLYIMLAIAVAERWQHADELAPFVQIQAQLLSSAEAEEIDSFVAGSFDIMRAGFPFANNPYLQETLENFLPAISRSYHIALERRRSEMKQFLNTFATLLQAVIARDAAQIREVLQAYGKHNCKLVLAALAER